MANSEGVNRDIKERKNNRQAEETRRMTEAEKRLVEVPHWLKDLKATVSRQLDSYSCGDSNVVIGYETIEELCRQVKWHFGWVDSDFLAEFMEDSSYAIRNIYLEISMSDPLLKDFYRRIGGWDFHRKVYFAPTAEGLQACYYVLYTERMRQQMQKDLAVMVVSEELGQAVDGHTNRHELPPVSSFRDTEEMDVAIKKAQVDKT